MKRGMLVLILLFTLSAVTFAHKGDAPQVFSYILLNTSITNFFDFNANFTQAYITYILSGAVQKRGGSATFTVIDDTRNQIVSKVIPIYKSNANLNFRKFYNPLECKTKSVEVIQCISSGDPFEINVSPYWTQLNISMGGNKVTYRKVIGNGTNLRVKKDEGALQLGNVLTLTKIKFGQKASVKVIDNSPTVITWLGKEDDDLKDPAQRDEITDPAPEDLLFACSDLDQNNECDFRAAERCKGDLYQGMCCGLDFMEGLHKVGEEVVGCTQRQVIEEVTLQNGSKENQTVTYHDKVMKNITAWCGKPDGETFQWAHHEEPGVIHDFGNFPGGYVVSDGTNFKYCGQQTQATGDGLRDSQSNRMPIGQNGLFLKPKVTTSVSQQACGTVISHSVEGEAHEIMCDGTKMYECAGKSHPNMGGDNVFSDINDFGTGDFVKSGTNTMYCANDFDWTTDIDTKNTNESFITCEKAKNESGIAGFVFTGSKCCSEAEDQPNEYYNDELDSFKLNNFYPAGSKRNLISAGCWEGRIVMRGDHPPQTPSVVNNQGKFFGCLLNPNNTTQQNLLNLRDKQGGNQLITNVASCGPVVPAEVVAGPGIFKVCQPWGEWETTRNALPTALKTSPYDTRSEQLVIMRNSTKPVRQQGCCAENECWDGFECQQIGTFIKTKQSGEKGYRCVP